MFVYLHMMLSRYVLSILIAQSYIHNDVMMCTKYNAANYRLHYTCKTLDNTLQGVANEQIYMTSIFIQII